MNSFKIQTSNIVCLVISLLCILAFCMVGIFPNMAAIRETDEEIEQLNNKVHTQELLYPLYRELIREATRKTPSTLSIPEKDEVPRNDLSRINAMFYQLAQDNQVTFLSAVPDASSYLEDTGHLTMNVDFSGDFFQLRGLLLGICQLPYLDVVEQMTLETENNNKRMRFKLKFVQAQ